MHRLITCKIERDKNRKVKVLHHHKIKEAKMDKMNCKIKECNTLDTTRILHSIGKKDFASGNKGEWSRSNLSFFANINEQ